MGRIGIGQAVERVEDARLLIGHGRYTDDISLENQANAAAALIDVDDASENLARDAG